MAESMVADNDHVTSGGGCDQPPDQSESEYANYYAVYAN